jgi:hypothetical protein
MANSVFEHVDEVVKLGGDNYGQSTAGQFGGGGEGSNLGAHIGPEGIGAALGGDVLQSTKQLSAGGTVGDTETNMTTNTTSVVVLNIS